MTNLFQQEQWARRGETTTTTSSIGMSETPVGVPLPWPSTTAPIGWLICDGSAVPAGCPTLTALYGANLPDLRGKVIVGYNAAETEFDLIGETGGTKTHTLTLAEIPVHSHDLQRTNEAATSVGPDASVVYRILGNTGTFQTSTQGAGSGGAHNNLQPYKVFNYIVRAA